MARSFDSLFLPLRHLAPWGRGLANENFDCPLPTSYSPTPRPPDTPVTQLATKTKQNDVTSPGCCPFRTWQSQKRDEIRHNNFLPSFCDSTPSPTFQKNPLRAPKSATVQQSTRICRIRHLFYTTKKKIPTQPLNDNPPSTNPKTPGSPPVPWFDVCFSLQVPSCEGSRRRKKRPQKPTTSFPALIGVLWSHFPSFWETYPSICCKVARNALPREPLASPRDLLSPPTFCPHSTCHIHTTTPLTRTHTSFLPALDIPHITLFGPQPLNGGGKRKYAKRFFARPNSLFSPSIFPP